MPFEYRDDGASTRDSPPPDGENDIEAQNGNLHVTSDSPSSATSAPFPSPVWMRESAKSFKYKWVPTSVRQSARAVARWAKGPEPPRTMQIKPFYPTIQEAPIRFMERLLPKRRYRIFLLGFVCFCWFLAWSLMVRHNSTAGYIQGYGKPQNLWCGASLWNSDNGCGINGNDCRPFSSANIPFRCGANCLSVQLLEPYYVGNESLVYEGLVVGGPNPSHPDPMPTYRADSYICQAAIHAGVISNEKGGCGVATLVGSQPDFVSSKKHGIRSTSFLASFPRSFAFKKLSESQASCPSDSRWPLFAVTAVTLVLISVFTTSPAAFFWSTFFILILHVGLVSDPPNDPTILDLISKLFSRLLPASFIAFILYRYCAVPQLQGLTAQFEKTILYLGMAFIGALNNYTFGPLIPIQRLTPHDIKAQPGAPLALALILILIITIALGQVHFLRLSGLLPKYLRLYLTMVTGLIILLVIPGLRLRIHHYILAILLMPGTALQTRPGLLYQGLLLGLFVNGVARWGFASIVQTPAALGEYGGNRGGASWWGARPPNATAVVGPGASNITFRWGALPAERGVDGVSVLVNDVERWRGYVDNELHEDETQVTFPGKGKGRWGGPDPEVEFFRLAYMKGSQTGKYSGVGTWDAEGVWHGFQGK